MPASLKDYISLFFQDSWKTLNQQKRWVLCGLALIFHYSLDGLNICLGDIWIFRFAKFYGWLIDTAIYIGWRRFQYGRRSSLVVKFWTACLNYYWTTEFNSLLSYLVFVNTSPIQVSLPSPLEVYQNPTSFVVHLPTVLVQYLFRNLDKWFVFQVISNNFIQRQYSLNICIHLSSSKMFSFIMLSFMILIFFFWQPLYERKPPYPSYSVVWCLMLVKEDTVVWWRYMVTWYLCTKHHRLK